MSSVKVVEIIKEIKARLKVGDILSFQDYLQAEIDEMSDELTREDNTPTNFYNEIDKVFIKYPSYCQEQEDAVIREVLFVLTGDFLVPLT